MNEFIENNNNKINEIKNKHKKDIDNLNNQIKNDLDKLNNEYDNKIEDNLKKLKTNFEKIAKDFKNQNDININYKNSLNDINNKFENTKIIFQNLNKINDNKNKINIENKKIDKYESINNKTKIFKITQFYNKILFKDITNNCENEEKENELVQKLKITFKKDEEENDKIIYEVSNLYKDWDFKRHMVNIIKRINRTRIVHRVNLNQLKHIYIMKFNDKQIHFEKINKIVQNNNFYVKIKNGFIFVNNKRRKFKNNTRNKFNNKKFNKKL